MGSMAKHPDQSHGWRMFRFNDSIFGEKGLNENVIDEGEHNLCASTLYKGTINLKANGYDKDKVSIVILLLEDLLQLTMKYLNGHISLNESTKNPIEIFGMIQYVSIMLFADLTDLSTEKTIEIL